jgi:hypothetical protein
VDIAIQVKPGVYRIDTGGGLVLSCSLLAGLELLEVPTANGHVTLILVHAIGEALDVGGAGTLGFGGGVLSVQGVGHGIPGSCVGIGRCLLLFDRRRGASAEEPSDRVAD